MIKIALFILLALELWFSDFGSCAKSRSFSLFKSTQVAPRTTKTSLKPTSFYSGARLDNLERLQKVISRAGVASRRDAEKLILEGRVIVNGALITELGKKVDTRKDRIQVNGRLVGLPDVKEVHWIVINKPKGVLAVLKDEKGRQTIADLIPKANSLRLVPVGGMDRDHSGLMLLTNDVGWIHPLTHPSYEFSRQYEVIVRGLISQEVLAALNSGQPIPRTEISLPQCSVILKDVDQRNQLSLLVFQSDKLSMSKIEELLESIHLPVESSKSVSFGPVKLKGLKKGDWRELTSVEIDKLKKSCKLSPVK